MAWHPQSTEVEVSVQGGRAPSAFREGSAHARPGVWAAHWFLTLCNILALSLRSCGTSVKRQVVLSPELTWQESVARPFGCPEISLTLGL